MVKNKLTGSIVLVTGGAGFIGSQIVEQLLPLKPKKVFVLDNFYRGKIKNLTQVLSNRSIELIKGDIRNESLISKLISRSDYCFHLAAMSLNACAVYPLLAFDVMIKAHYNLIRLVAKAKLKKFIFSSSASVYGMAQHFPTPEIDNPYDNQTLYGASKLFVEQLLHIYHYTHNLDYIALRYFNVYGLKMDIKGRYTAVFIKWLQNFKDNVRPTIIGDGKTTMDFVNVKDVVKANILAAQSDISDEVFNIGSGRETSLLEVLALLLKINRSSLKPRFISTKVTNPVSRRKADVSKVKRLLGFTPRISLEEGLKELSDWYYSKKS